MSGQRAPAAGVAARRAALEALRAVEEDGSWSNLAVPEAIAALPEARDRAFAAHLAYDTLRWDGTLRWALGHASRRPLEEIEPPIARVLRLGALQLLFARTPARAAVDTAVALARTQVPRGRQDGAGGFVNGVLRGLGRQLDELPWPDPDLDPVDHLRLRTGHPSWIVADLRHRFDDERVAAVLAADNEPPGVTLRATGSVEALVAELAEDGVEATPGAVPGAGRAPRGATPARPTGGGG
ncbi:MAG: hypothetical protein JJT89_09950, partial [Nitriliruptoraceae bacterium]|nr:hypothetical protein [Nitriliruptoraceae bacterium]